MNSKSYQAIVVPDWGANDFKTGTIRAVIRQLSPDWDEFRNA
jgi:hypothetical protein